MEAAAHNWVWSISYAAQKEKLDQPAMIRPISVGSATATFAARLASAPMMSSVQGNHSSFFPDRLASMIVIELATHHAVDAERDEHCPPGGLAVADSEFVHVAVADHRGDVRQNDDAECRRPPNTYGGLGCVRD